MKYCKKLISIVIIAAILLAIPGFSASVARAAEENLPVVFIGGKGTKLVDKDGNMIFPRSFDIAGAVEKVVPVLTEANITLDYDEFSDVLCETVADLYEGLPLDCNGNALNGTNTDFTWTKTTLSWSVREDEPYRIFDYCFYYDWRLDPLETADSLAQYIDDILEVTGAPKVKIIGRCMGGNIVLAYLSKYGGEKVDRCLFYVSTINGVSTCGAGFSSSFYIDTDAVGRFASDLGMDGVFTLGDETLNSVIMSVVKMLCETGGIDLAVAAVRNVYDIVKENVVPRLLLSTYATFPSYWSMIGDDYYDAAKKCVFAGKEKEYAGLIAKIDNYHYNVQTKATEILKSLQENGLDITIVCKYGAQQVPISKEYNMLSDNTVELYRSSFGATCTDLDKTFDESYMKNAAFRGTAKYISPDKQVDASTCLFPDNTWIIKNCSHSDFSSSIDELMMTIMRYPGRMSIYDNPDYPQYLLNNRQENLLLPLTEENCYTTQRWDISYFDALLSAIKATFLLISKSSDTAIAL